MPLFGRSNHHHHKTSRMSRFRSRFGRKDPDRVAGGFKAALANPNTTRSGRKHAKRELKLMGRGDEAHVSLMTKIKRTLGIRSTSRSQRHTLGKRRRY
ncbi:hypothetical protein V8D89_011424 [Ganoderma adspersum]